MKINLDYRYMRAITYRHRPSVASSGTGDTALTKEDLEEWDKMNDLRIANQNNKDSLLGKLIPVAFGLFPFAVKGFAQETHSAFQNFTLVSAAILFAIAVVLLVLSFVFGDIGLNQSLDELEAQNSKTWWENLWTRMAGFCNWADVVAFCLGIMMLAVFYVNVLMQ